MRGGWRGGGAVASGDGGSPGSDEEEEEGGGGGGGEKTLLIWISHPRSGMQKILRFTTENRRVSGVKVRNVLKTMKPDGDLDGLDIFFDKIIHPHAKKEPASDFLLNEAAPLRVPCGVTMEGKLEFKMALGFRLQLGKPL